MSRGVRTGYKCLAAGRVPPIQGGDPLPVRRWLPKTTPRPCESGWHWCRNAADVLAYLSDEVWEVKVRGRTVEGDDKAVSEEMILVRRVMGPEDVRAFMFDCLARIQPVADVGGFGDEWRRMCEERTEDACDAAGAAAWAVGDAWYARAAWAAEREWQTDRLNHYLTEAQS